jgi:tRNA(Arg) A34 adenosine deaminase TadA
MLKHRIVKAALETSRKSNFTKHPMGCVIFKGNEIVSSGCNLMFGSGSTTLHAEQNAIEQLARRHGRLRHLRRLLNKSPLSTTMGVSHVDSLLPYGRQSCRKDRTL